jgi:hypothetical protein
VANVGKILAKMAESPNNIRYDDLRKVCVEYFGAPRQEGSSHAVFRTPWQGDPRVNIQEEKNGMAKPYQVRQVLGAVEKTREEVDGTE